MCSQSCSDEPGPVKGAGDGGTPFDQSLDDATAAQLVEDTGEVALQLEGGMDLGIRGRLAQHDP